MVEFKFKLDIPPKPIQSVRYTVLKDRKTGRIRYDKRGNPIIVKYQPKANENYKKEIAKAIKIRMMEQGLKLQDEVAIEFSYIMYKYEVQKSMPNYILTQVQKWDAGYSKEPVYKVSKPDVMDNLNKGIMDAMEGVLYANDSKVFIGRPLKVYSYFPGIEGVIRFYSCNKRWFCRAKLK